MHRRGRRTIAVLCALIALAGSASWARVADQFLAPLKLIVLDKVTAPDGVRARVLRLRQPCTPTPVSGCTAAASSSLKLIERAGAPDVMKWKWTGPGPINVGDPLATTTLAFCVYEGSGAGEAVLSGQVDPGGTCVNNKPCWKATAVGHNYVDKEGTPDGVTKTKIALGGVAPAKLSVLGKGATIPPLGLPYTLPVTVQLQSSGGGCWEGSFSLSTKNDALQFLSSQWATATPADNARLGI